MWWLILGRVIRSVQEFSYLSETSFKLWIDSRLEKNKHVVSTQLPKLRAKLTSIIMIKILLPYI